MIKISLSAIFLLCLLTNCEVKTERSLEVPSYFGKFREVPPDEIQPTGWLRTYLEIQKDGLTGNLEHAGYPFNQAGWGKEVKDTSTWWPYEQTGYWIDGMITAGYLLDDSTLIQKAQDRIYPVLAQATKDDPFIGPEYLRKSGKKYRWVHAVYFRALMKEYLAAKNPTILEKMVAFHLDQPIERYLEVRDHINIENMLWLYGQQRDSALLAKAIDIYDQLNYQGKMSHRPVKAENFLSDGTIYEHGVTYNEVAKLGAILYLYTGQEEYLAPSVAAYEKLQKLYMMIDGVNVSSEHLHTPVDALHTHETCDIADMTWSLGYLLMASGNPTYADQIERAIYNAGPGAATSDFKALQYFSGPNQVLATMTSNHNQFFKGNESMAFGPNPFTECCPGNVTRITPNFAARLWMRDDKNGIVAAMYAPSTWTGTIKNQKVVITQSTEYPFRESIIFTFQLDKSLDFPFTFRIPSWCKAPSAMLNGNPISIKLTPGSYQTLHRRFAPGDQIEIQLPPQTSFVSSYGGIALTRGPLVYALPIKTKKTIVQPDVKKPRSTTEFPAYNTYPDSEWRYALQNLDVIQEEVIIEENLWTGNPWSLENAPLSIKVPARIISGWNTVKTNKVLYEQNVPVQENGFTVWKPKSDFVRVGEFEFTPKLPDLTNPKYNISTKVDTVTLVPYGCTDLRLTIFPEIGSLQN
ncbi:MAG: glycoside hydrolase family 127 protein [Cyclobacteriaceae bacterium]|nr:glycoside hydrolase family 127 protein [Cyclobacteriaceae bacterium HetDA_MAG_MS6]